MMYQSGTAAGKILSGGTLSGVCSLAVGEYVKHVTTYGFALTVGTSQYPVIGGIMFKTDRQTCGPYGPTTGAVHTASGHALLYISGASGLGFDQFNFAFD